MDDSSSARPTTPVTCKKANYVTHEEQIAGKTLTHKDKNMQKNVRYLRLQCESDVQQTATRQETSTRNLQRACTFCNDKYIDGMRR